MRARDRVAAGLLACGLVVILQVVRGHADWGPSEGVYALSSRLLLDGGDLYGGLVASQPPWVYLFGAVPLAIHDSLDSLRIACGLLQVLTGLLAGEAVWRLTGNRVAAFAAVPLVLVTPWATHQHGLLLPEQLGAPLLLGAALLAARPTTARWAGVVAGLAVFAKFPFALPAVALIAASPGRRTAALWAAGALVAQAALFSVIFGSGFWTDVVKAQIQAGEGLESVPLGGWAQAGWNLLPLLALSAAALVLRRHAKEPALLGTVAAAAAGALLTVLTIVKPGTGLNVIVPSEPLLATLGVCGVTWALETPARVRAAIAATAVGSLMLAQSASVLVDASDPRPFHRPGSANAGWKASYTRAQMRELVDRAERCPPGAVWAGPPLAAFIARRHVPADQPDAFIVGHAEVHERVLARARAARPRCL